MLPLFPPARTIVLKSYKGGQSPLLDQDLGALPANLTGFLTPP